MNYRTLITLIFYDRYRNVTACKISENHIHLRHLRSI